MSFRKDLGNKLFGLFGNSENSGSRFKSYQALTDITLKLEEGDRLGLIGPNGAGKSTLLRVLSGSFVPTKGTIIMRGEITSLIQAGLGMDLEQSGYDNIYTCALVLGLPLENLDEIREDIVEFCDLGEHIHYPVRTYSSGMLVRLSFAIATAVKPDILLIDEIIGAGDAKFMQKSRDRIDRLFNETKTLILASHSVPTMKQYCNKGLFLKDGEIQFLGPIDDALGEYHNWINS